MGFRQAGQYFAVELYICPVEFVYQPTVADTVLSGGGVYFNLPQPAKVSLFLFSVGELE